MIKLSNSEIICMVSKETGYSTYAVEKIIKSLFDCIILFVSKGYAVGIKDFGVFRQQKRASRVGRNPHSNKPVPIPARLSPMFKPGNKFKQLAQMDLKK